MGNIFNDDFRDFISSLNSQGVEYILIGGYSVILHGYPRTTGDLDIWVNRTEENYSRILNSFNEFGMGVFDMTKENFLNNPEYDVFSFGRPPVSIDLLVKVKGLHFDEAFRKSFVKKVDQIEVRVIHIDDLRAAKKASNRPKDRNDLDNLES
ncbi:MAG: nucleotidyltransferase [Imperialibacter sp.]|uniref:nucleotidyltransferase n=1 Tax=Imperialibacter sp. TaxID=2038411 RepID=UPI0032EE78F1